MRRGLLAIVLALAGGGCGGGPAAPADATAGADAANPTGPRAGRVALHHVVALETGYASSHAMAEVGIGRLPSRTAEDLRTPIASAGECRLMQMLPPDCDPECITGWCWPDGSCRTGNFGTDAGPVTIEGARLPIELRFDQGYAGGGEPVLFSSGATIRAHAPGGAWQGVTAAGFDVTGVAPEALDLAIPGGILALDPAGSTTLTWTPSARPDARYSLRIGTAHGHGGRSEYMLACDGPDTGSVTIAPVVAAGLPPLPVPNCLGLTCVMAELRRHTRAEAPTADGTVVLELGDIRWFYADNAPR